MNKLNIRTAVPADGPELLKIYAPYVKKTAITYEWEAPTEEEFSQRIETTLQRYPYLVLEQGGQPIGYAYAGVYKARRAYDWCAESSIYLREDCRGQGLGELLQTSLEQVLDVMGVCNLYACVTCTDGEEDETVTNKSIHFHTRVGFEEVGRFRRCGYKFGRWYDTAWLCKELNPHAAKPMPFRPFPKVKKELGL